MITIRPLSTQGTMTRRAINLITPKPVRESLVQAIADSTDTFSRKPVQASVTSKQANKTIKASKPAAPAVAKPVDRFTHNLETVEALPDNVLMASDKLIYGPVYGYAEDASKTPDEARRALGNLSLSYGSVGTECRRIIMEQARKAGLENVTLLEFA